jgi:hypothetical protein
MVCLCGSATPRSCGVNPCSKYCPQGESLFTADLIVARRQSSELRTRALKNDSESILNSAIAEMNRMLTDDEITSIFEMASLPGAILLRGPRTLKSPWTNLTSLTSATDDHGAI